MASQTSYAPVDQKMEVGGPPKVTSRSSTHSEPRSRWTTWTEDGWLLEIASTVLGVAFIISLVVILHHYEGQPFPQFGSFMGTALTLNTVVAILSIAAKTALLYPVAECVSQWKWLWFSKEYRPLSDISIFDKASRGIRGGLELLWRTKLR